MFKLYLVVPEYVIKNVYYICWSGKRAAIYVVKYFFCACHTSRLPGNSFKTCLPKGTAIQYMSWLWATGDKLHYRLIIHDKATSDLEALGEEHDLGDLWVVGHHHGHGTEQRLEVVRQLNTTSIPGWQNRAWYKYNKQITSFNFHSLHHKIYYVFINLLYKKTKTGSQSPS